MKRTSTVRPSRAKQSVGRKKELEEASPVDRWFGSQGWSALPFQHETWRHIAEKRSGLLNAPTGTGKTYAIWGGIVNAALKDDENSKRAGLRAIWITPLRALASEIAESAQRMCEATGLPWTVGARTGDTTAKQRAAQKKQLPHLLVTTPESLHVLLSQKGSAALFKNLDWFVADEWHELLGSKRGVQVELALSRLKALRPQIGIWGVSATIGNLEEAMSALLGVDPDTDALSIALDPFPGQVQRGVLVRAAIDKPIEMHTLLPERVEHYPWAGHLGLKLAKQLLPIIAASTSTLIFTNTRSQAETWYQHLLEIA
ncbi:MAG: DEAD/DEAH box helicase, partial [Flavobacteriales bacterium]